MTRLNDGLRAAGVDSRIFTAEGANASLLAPVTTELRQYLPRRPAGAEFFSDDRSPHGAALLARLPKADIVHLHWVARFVDYSNFFAVAAARRTPLVWTLHDINPATGGCHYADGCTRFETACGACPQLLSMSQDDLARSIWRRKAHAYTGLHAGQLRLVAPSRWLAGEICRSTLLRDAHVEHIPGAVDTRLFSPVDPREARRELGLPEDAWLVLFVAASLQSRRKGFDLLDQALGTLAVSWDGADRPELVTVGAQEPAEPACGLRCHHLGPMDDDRRLALAYSAADLFVIPSREDNLPNTVVEALACGTPALGFAVGGIPELIRPGETGLLAPAEDAEALAAAMGRLLRDRDLRLRLAAQARSVAEREYGLTLHAARYRAIYAEQARWARQARDAAGLDAVAL
jgi:glycosyltransferase involved in cell wall biosynthesis